MRRVFLMVVLAAGCACERKPATEGRMISIEANLKSLRQVPGRLKADAGPESPFTAYFQQMDIQLIDEIPVEGGPVRNRYYFTVGKLFYFRQLRADKVEKQFVIDKNGKMLKPVPVDLGREESERITARAEALREAAVARAGNMFVFPLMRSR